MVTIRAAIPDDANVLARLAERTFRDAFLIGTSPTDMELHCANNFSTEIQRREIVDPDYLTILADSEGELVGFAQISPNTPKQCVHAERPSELHRLYVSSEWHGLGVAHELMCEVMAISARGGVDCVWLGVWEKNPRAIAFYRKHGFKVVGDHVFQVGVDRQRDVVMQAEVDRHVVDSGRDQLDG